MTATESLSSSGSLSTVRCSNSFSGNSAAWESIIPGYQSPPNLRIPPVELTGILQGRFLHHPAGWNYPRNHYVLQAKASSSCIHSYGLMPVHDSSIYHAVSYDVLFPGFADTTKVSFSPAYKILEKVPWVW